jgi:hypothetical protein
MLSKKIKYTDFNDTEREETFYFNLSEAELTDWELSVQGTLTEHIKRINETVDIPQLISLYKELIDRSYGIKDADGRRFRKSPEILQDLKDTNAYSELYMELATNDKAGAEFISGIVSNKLRALMEQGVANGTIDPNHPALKK